MSSDPNAAAPATWPPVIWLGATPLAGSRHCMQKPEANRSMFPGPISGPTRTSLSGPKPIRSPAKGDRHWLSAAAWATTRSTWPSGGFASRRSTSRRRPSPGAKRVSAFGSNLHGGRSARASLRLASRLRLRDGSVHPPGLAAELGSRPFRRWPKQSARAGPSW